MSDQERIEREGQVAFKQGKKFTDNPFDEWKQQDQWEWWAEGFMDAEYEYDSERFKWLVELDRRECPDLYR